MNNLFTSNLSKSNSEIKESRAKRIGQQAEMAQDDLVRVLKSDVLDIEAKLDDLEDLSPNTTMSLNPTKGEFKAKEWVAAIQLLSVELEEKKFELTVAEKTYAKYFIQRDQRQEAAQ